ncbi:uncharacterized protein [Spinacia oleracea]|uniref:Endonuclease/exonuclease/phosphatase domain-containing protein n=1 Tax=Spinacia oleracea TaxID=3562 RepID=A0ABM3RR87_SPIOL|nr:uncharacterized protein LOC130471828 [Spinacia oleracea]
MNICSWNVRGLNDPNKVGEIKKFVVNNNVRVVAFLKTRVKEQKSKKIQEKFGSSWSWWTNYEFSPGGESGLAESIIALLFISFRKLIRRPMWATLNNINSLNAGPWLVMGDFNLVLVSGDKINGNAVTHSETVDFEDCLDHAELTEVKSRGHLFCWYKGHGNNIINCRIDRALGNISWHTAYADVVVDYMNPGLSDNTPLLLSYKVNIPKRGGRS